MITVEELRHPDQKKTACYDIDVEVDDTLKTQMNSFLLSTASQQVHVLYCILWNEKFITGIIIEYFVKGYLLVTRNYLSLGDPIIG